MKKIRLALTIMLAVFVTAVFSFASTGTAFAKDETWTTPLLEVGGKTIMERIETWPDEGDPIYETKYYPENLPAGVTYDQTTHVLMLDNVTLNKVGPKDDAYISAQINDFQILLKGKNTFSGAVGQYETVGIKYYNDYEGEGAHEMKITGADASASLTIDMTTGNKGKLGIVGKEKLKLENFNYNFNGKNTGESYIYAITMHAWANEAEGYDDCEVSIENMNINIANTVPQSSRSYNVGIDSQDSDLDIDDSKINIKVTGGNTLGIGVGLYQEFFDDDYYDDDEDDEDDTDYDDDDYDYDDEDYGYKNFKANAARINGDARRVHGGMLEIDDDSVVTIRAYKPNDFLKSMDYITPLYYYNDDAEYADKIESPFVYTADLTTGKGAVGRAAIRVHTWVQERFESRKSYIEFSPYKATLSKTAYTYNGTARKPAVTVTDAYGNTVPATVSYSSNKNAGGGLATIKVGNGTIYRLFSIAKAAQKMTVKPKTAKVKYSKLKKKNQTLAVKKVLTIKNAKGTKSFKKVKGNSKITINKKTGKVTVKKGLKKGTYKITVKVKASGGTNFKAMTKKVTFKVRVK